jgi:ribosomal protein S18 acetylase RimI-like enzyme
MTSSTIIREFVEKDRSQVIGLWEQCGLTRPWNDPDKDIDRKLKSSPEQFLMMEHLDDRQTQIVGTAMYGYDGHRGSVYYLGVHPDWQRRGAGRELMAEVENRLLQLGCAKINVMVRSTNADVLDFYRRLGFEANAVEVLGKRLIADQPDKSGYGG